MRLFYNIIFLLSFSTPLLAQNIIRTSINSSGSTLSNGNFSLSQTIGQSGNINPVIYNGGFDFFQGFQQPNMDNESRRIERLNASVYPNPNDGSFTLSFPDRQLHNISYELINALGKVVNEGKASIQGDYNFKFKIATGIYLFRVHEKDYETEIIKIVVLRN